MSGNSEVDLENLPRTFFDDSGEVIQVAFSQYQVVVRFEHMTIDVQSKCEIALPNGERWSWKPEEIGNMVGFGGLLGSSVRRFQVSDKKLLLIFSNGYTLQLAGDETGYESFIISKEGGYGGVIV